MTLRPLPLIAVLALLTAPVILPAQETTANEDERIEQLVRSEASEWYTPKNSVSVGFRIMSSGVNVRFGNLGAVAFSSTIAPASAGAVSRTYDNGYVNLDSLRSDEVDSNGNQTSTPGGRYQTYSTTSTPVTDENGNVTGSVTTPVLVADSLSYTPGLTRIWGYSTPEQNAAIPGYIAMSSYSATSDGGSYSKKQGPTAGVELQFSHAIRKLSKRVELSFVAGIGLSSINSKTSGDVKSTLHTYTDYYSLNGQAAPETSVEVPYSAPSRPDGITETTPPLTAVPDDSLHSTTTAAGAATVHGRWQIKGAYFMLRLGPSLRAQVTDRFGMSASLGLAGAYAGTQYTAVESMEVPVVGTTLTDPINVSNATKFLTGYYADFNLEWTANETLGLYGGVSAQKFGDYTQTLGERNALIDLGSTVGLRGGVNIKF